MEAEQAHQKRIWNMKLRLVAGAAALLFTLTSLDSFSGDKVEKGQPETPSNSKAIAGAYYRGDGLGMNISLHLKNNGKYNAEWHGCLGKYGESSGKWKLKGGRIVFLASKEKGMLTDFLKPLETCRFNGDWILVPTEKPDRRFYEDYGVARMACFQKARRVE